MCHFNREWLKLGIVNDKIRSSRDDIDCFCSVLAVKFLANAQKSLESFGVARRLLGEVSEFLHAMNNAKLQA